MTLRFANGNRAVPVFADTGAIIVVQVTKGSWRSFGTQWVVEHGAEPFLALITLCNPQPTEKAARAALQRYVETGGRDRG